MFVADMHCDTIYEIYNRRLKGEKCDLSKNNLHIDAEKLDSGNYILQSFALYVDLNNTENPYSRCMELVELFNNQMSGDVFGLARSFSEIEENRRAGKISALLAVEDGGVVDGSLENLRNLYMLGVRMITLTWNYKNCIGHPNIKLIEGKKPDFYTPDAKNGLTGFGIDFVREMERSGMIIDVSHLSDAGFYDVFGHTEKPFVASHSNAREICGNVRNLTDDMIKKIARRGGVIGINFFPGFLTGGEYADDSGALLDAVVRHIRHIANVGGYECVGLGSDFDGMPGNSAMPDASHMPKLFDVLQKSGFTQGQIEAIYYKNVLRVLKEVLKDN